MQQEPSDHLTFSRFPRSRLTDVPVVWRVHAGQKTMEIFPSVFFPFSADSGIMSLFFKEVFFYKK